MRENFDYGLCWNRFQEERVPHEDSVFDGSEAWTSYVLDTVGTPLRFGGLRFYGDPDVMAEHSEGNRDRY
jgi:hypothetical protein